MSAYDKQIGGTHYRTMKIQPSKFVIENKMLFAEGNVVKYICRHPYKDGKQEEITPKKNLRKVGLRAITNGKRITNEYANTTLQTPN